MISSTRRRRCRCSKVFGLFSGLGYRSASLRNLTLRVPSSNKSISRLATSARSYIKTVLFDKYDYSVWDHVKQYTIFNPLDETTTLDKFQRAQPLAWGGEQQQHRGRTKEQQN